MNFLDALLTRSLLGTSRDNAPLPAPPPELADLIQDSSPEQSLLRAAAACALRDRAGRLPLKKSPATFDLPPDKRPICSPRAAALLKRLLDGTELQLLIEWVSSCTRAARRPPPQLLPVLFDAATRPFQKASDLPRAIARQAGPLGLWLCSQNPAWSSLISSAPTTDPAEIWQTGTKPERLAALRTLRQTNAGAARELLISTFSSEPAADRAAFLETFEANPSPDDEPFLESCLSDRGKEVRAAAIKLLSRLPNSAFVSRMISRAAPLIKYTPSTRAGLLKKARPPTLQVELPGEPDGAAKTDGLTGKALGPWGPRQATLFHALLAIPPAHWSKSFGTTPDELLAADAGDHRELLKQAWTESAFVHRDPEWIAAVCRLQINDPQSHLNPQLLTALQPAQVNELARLVLSRRGTPLPLVLTIVSARPIAPDVARALIDFAARASDKNQWQNGHLIPDVALTVPPELFPEFQSAWDKNETIESIFGRNALDRFFERLNLRHQIAKEFGP